MVSVWNVPEKEPPIQLFRDKSEWGTFMPGLAHVRHALEKIGSPQRAYRHVLIGGTNGKGSVAANLSLNLPVKSGCLLSPHVVDLRERILVDGEPVSDEIWRKAYLFINQYVSDDELSYFEWTLVIACVVFAMLQIEIAVFEVGVGGREDATNVLQPEVSCIVSLGLDHQAILGNSLQAIAMHKIGIGRPEKPFLIPRSLAAYPEIQQVLQQQKSYVEFHDSEGFQDNPKIVQHLLQLLGFSSSLKKWIHKPGRRMSIQLSGANWYLDGAHNEMAWRDLKGWLDQSGVGCVPMICGLSVGRDPGTFIQIMHQYIKKLYVWHFNPERQVRPSLWTEKALEANLELLWLDPERFASLKSQTCIVTGSLYIVGQALRALDGSNQY